MKSTRVLLLLSLVACLLAQVEKISADSLLDLMTADTGKDTSEDITTRNLSACKDEHSEEFCDRFKSFCAGHGGVKNQVYVWRKCRRTCGVC
ncbi:unnamed protein product [Pocillopora meandrina]|uniref:ShKT domain-containing protein n=1 Tax=Pocillopora meandrina TaxID=46732 RepID=A0AAU9W173_9CNID|nr:unnamed protein product [Pocillopora meandrina]